MNNNKRSLTVLLHSAITLSLNVTVIDFPICKPLSVVNMLPIAKYSTASVQLVLGFLGCSWCSWKSLGIFVLVFSVFLVFLGNSWTFLWMLGVLGVSWSFWSPYTQDSNPNLSTFVVCQREPGVRVISSDTSTSQEFSSGSRVG